MESKFIHFAGIDVSKHKFDVCLLVNQEKSTMLHDCFDQSTKGFRLFLKWLREHTNNQIERLLVCVENTGLYDDGLLYFMDDQKIAVCLENAATVKQSIRDQRAKNDWLDARNIALYALKHFDELKLWQRPRKIIDDLKEMLTIRAQLVNALKSLKMAFQEKKSLAWARAGSVKDYRSGVKGLEKDIEQIEKDIWSLVKSDEQALQMVVLMMSIPSVGKITAYHFLCYTNEFKTVKDGKNLSSYCGVVPFEQTSGTSKKTRPRVSHKANKKLKTLLHLCALTAVKTKSAFAAFYRRKIEEGKHAMNAINAVRHKIVLTIAAVIRTRTPYDYEYFYSQNLKKP